MKQRSALAIVFCLLAMPGWAQTPLPTQWHHLDPAADKVMGISTNRAYELLRQLPAPTGAPVTVAVIDSGVDTLHVDLHRVLWRNPKEIAGNSRDDDKNGYTDDVYGWNFLGSKDGRNLLRDQKEETRLYARLKPRYEGKTLATVPAAQQAEFRLYEQAKAAYTRKTQEAQEAYQRDTQQLTEDQAALASLKKTLQTATLDTALLRRPATADTSALRLAKMYYQGLRQMRLPNTDTLLNRFVRYNRKLKDRLDYDYNLAYDPRPLIGDQPTDLTERHYGNSNLSAPLKSHGTAHGTHCAGIIAADRRNTLGVQGIADHVRILAVRAVPDGDEHDKDIANAIRYAVDHGAKIISMSFGKYFSPEKSVVDEAMRYAEARGVLLVHAAGNDHLDYDTTPAYPSTRYLSGKDIPNLITVGASARTNDESLAASFSNYGRGTVDVFAPGMAILSTTPGSDYAEMSGTSMAAPVVAGVAAVLKTYFPQLTPADLKRIILQSAVPCHTQVRQPGSKQLVDFATLSKTGAIVNLYEALKLARAEQTTAAKKPAVKKS
ncbi:S8 family peptidase [Hymenobacter cellulosilyticus]|uniref:S8 family peptidase n=1 Tax=Hymenobacter cellulosilyticus TaxID=2932248 RepID=A0A8T9Q6A6_9BACT|nr:S8 family peptidase [Hymenobacter cellulosilyticus]UOQ70593.1 S8 family peptidase [Hymenobacter cellulosilyticus]